MIARLLLLLLALFPGVSSAADESWEDFAPDSWPHSRSFSLDFWDRRLDGEIFDILDRYEPVRLRASGKRVASMPDGSTVLEFEAHFSGLSPVFHGVVRQEALDPAAHCPAGAVRAHRLFMDLEGSDRLISGNFTLLGATICLWREGERWFLVPRVIARRSGSYSAISGPTIRSLLRDQVPSLMSALSTVWK